MGDPGPVGPNGDPGEILSHFIQFVKLIIIGLEIHFCREIN